MAWSARSFAANKLASALGARGLVLTRPRFHEEHPIDLRALLAEPIERERGNVVVVQIGANDGITNDPIFTTVQSRGWEIYAVEPAPGPYERLLSAYAGNDKAHPIPCAVGLEDGTATLFTIRQDRQPAGLPYDQFASFSRERVEHHWRYIPDVKDLVEPITVPVLTLTSLMDQHHIPRIDLLQIDTEGFDFEIIKMAFASGIRPPILAFEWVNLSQADMWECRTLLIEHGYRWLISMGDVIASRMAV